MTISNDSPIDRQAILAAARSLRPRMVEFTQRLIQTPSLPGEEAQIANLLADELRSLDCDDVWIDRAGNVIGAIRGRGGKSMHFNAHLDHVSPGDLSLWTIPPYEARIVDDVIFGRAACDLKGALAAQVYTAAILRAINAIPPGDVLVAGVVLEEVGGFGSKVLAEELPTDVAIIGEASRNQLRRGHRGRVFCQVDFEGLSAHASAPERARNPHYAEARFLLGLESLGMVQNETFGGSSASPTLSATDQQSGNVTPGRVTIFIDWRNVPEESAAQIRAKVEKLAAEAAAEVDGITAKVTIAERDVRTYTGIEATMPSTRGFETAADDPFLRSAQSALTSALDREVETGIWTFATDGGHLAHAGITCIGFGPGREEHAHTIWDQVGIVELEETLIGNTVMALSLGAVEIEQGASNV